MENKALIALAQELETDLPLYTKMYDPSLEFEVHIFEDVIDNQIIIRIDFYERIGEKSERKYYSLLDYFLFDKRSFIDRVIMDFELFFLEAASQEMIDKYKEETTN